MNYYVGIDQGASTTRAALMDAHGRLLSFRSVCGSSFPYIGIDKALDLIEGTVSGALADAGVAPGEVSTLVAGMAGIDWEGDEQRLTRALAKRFVGAGFDGTEIVACNDSIIAYYGGSLSPVGAVISAGTGINAALFAPGERCFIMGDYLKDSLQGAGALAERAYQAIIKAALGMVAETGLTELFLDFAETDTVRRLSYKFVCDATFRKSLQTLAPRIIELSAAGDPVAREVLESFADELCRYFIAALKKMDMLDLACDIVLTGSVFSGEKNDLTVLVQEGLRRQAKNAGVINAAFESVVGACLMGALPKNEVGAPISDGYLDEEQLHNLAVSARELGLVRVVPTLPEN